MDYKEQIEQIKKIIHDNKESQTINITININKQDDDINKLFEALKQLPMLSTQGSI